MTNTFTQDSITAPTTEIDDTLNGMNPDNHLFGEAKVAICSYFGHYGNLTRTRCGIGIQSQDNNPRSSCFLPDSISTMDTRSPLGQDNETTQSFHLFVIILMRLCHFFLEVRSKDHFYLVLVCRCVP